MSYQNLVSTSCYFIQKIVKLQFYDRILTVKIVYKSLGINFHGISFVLFWFICGFWNQHRILNFSKCIFFLIIYKLFLYQKL